MEYENTKLNYHIYAIILLVSLYSDIQKLTSRTEQTVS